MNSNPCLPSFLLSLLDRSSCSATTFQRLEGRSLCFFEFVCDKKMRVKFRALDGRCSDLELSHETSLMEASASVRNDFNMDEGIQMISRGRVVRSVTDLVDSEVVTVVQARTTRTAPGTPRDRTRAQHAQTPRPRRPRRPAASITLHTE